MSEEKGVLKNTKDMQNKHIFDFLRILNILDLDKKNPVYAYAVVRNRKIITSIAEDLQKVLLMPDDIRLPFVKYLEERDQIFLEYCGLDPATNKPKTVEVFDVITNKKRLDYDVPRDKVRYDEMATKLLALDEVHKTALDPYRQKEAEINAFLDLYVDQSIVDSIHKLDVSLIPEEVTQYMDILQFMIKD